MTFNLLLTAIISALTPNSLAQDVNGHEYSYLNMTGGMSVGLYENGSKVRVRDETIDAHSCSTETVVCIEAEGLFIAVPRRSVGLASDGTKVDTVKKMNMSFFGVRTRVHLIEAVRNTVRYQYWYSYDRGLMAFSIARAGNTATYLLGQTKGFKLVLEDGQEIQDPDK